MTTIYNYGDIICSAIDADKGLFRARVEVNGLRLSPPQTGAHIYLSDRTFSSVSDALHHGIEYINLQFPEGALHLNTPLNRK